MNYVLVMLNATCNDILDMSLWSVFLVGEARKSCVVCKSNSL